MTDYNKKDFLISLQQSELKLANLVDYICKTHNKTIEELEKIITPLCDWCEVSWVNLVKNFLVKIQL